MHRVPFNSQSNDSLIDTWSFTKNFTTFEKLPCNSQLSDIDFSRAIELTLPYTDADGNTLQLWKAEKYGLIGSVIDRSGKMQIVQSDRILNPMSGGVREDNLVRCLENCALKCESKEERAPILSRNKISMKKFHDFFVSIY